MKKKLFTIFQIIAAISILWFILSKIDKQELMLAIKTGASHWYLLVSAILTTFACLLFCTLRWKILLGAIGLKISYPRTFTLYFIGHFFNAMLPGVVGGDLPKAYYIAKETHHQKAEVVSTVFIDRIIGLIALIALSSIVMICKLDYFMSDNYTKLAMVFNLAILGAVSVGLIVVFQKNVFERFAFFRKLEEKTSMGKIISKVYNSFRTCLYNPKVLIQTMAISIFNHLLIILCAYQIGLALGINMSFWGYLTVFPTINSVAALPITPSGWGVREGVTKYLMGSLGVSQALAVPLSLLMGTTFLFWSIIGGIVYIVFASKEGKVNLSESASIEQ